MLFKYLIRRLARGEIALACGAALVGACATGVEPDRSAFEGLGGASSSSSVNSASDSSGPSSTNASTGTDVTSSTVGSGGGSAVASTAAATTGAGGGQSASSAGAGGSGSGAGGAPPTGLRVQYKIGDNDPNNDQIKAIFNIINDSGQSVPLSELSIRYWYTLEGGEQAQSFFCDYAMVGNGNVHGSFGQQVGVNADHYMELTFTAADVLSAGGGQSGELQARWNKSNFSAMDESNDYSRDSTKMNFADWDKVGLYDKDALIWGVEP